VTISILTTAIAALVPGILPVAEDPLAEALVRETKHYRILTEREALLEDYALLAEAARKGFQKELKLKAKMKRGERVTLRLYGSRRDWEAGMEHEQVFPLPGTNWVHYEPRVETVYVHGKLDSYYTRKMLLYGLFRQYHLRCKSKNRHLTKEWFITGMADVFSTHDWNGEALVLGARRRLAHEHRASLAVSRGALTRIADGELSVEDLAEWDVRWALTAFLMFGEDGAYRKDFQKFALGRKGSMLLGHDFLSNLGDPEEINGQLHAWLEEEDQALVAEYGSWTEVRGTLQGASTGGREFAIALASPRWTRLEARPDQKNKIARGLILDWKDPKEVKFALRQDSVLRVLHLTRGELRELDVFDLAGGRANHGRLAAELEGDSVHLMQDGRPLGTYEAPNRRLGLAVQRGLASFTDVAWE